MEQLSTDTSIEIIFRKMPDGLFREYTMVYTIFKNSEGKVVKSKINQEIPGRLFKIAGPNERSAYGETEYKFPEMEHPVRLIALGVDYNDRRYGRF